jgi:NapC/NirT cytochrome c family protein
MTDPSAKPRLRYSPLKHWVSLIGVVIGMASVFSFVLLVLIDLFSGKRNPYVGILTYLVAPMFALLGAILIGIGWIVHRRRLARLAPGVNTAVVAIDFSQPKQLRNLIIFLMGSGLFLFITAVGNYQTYHVTESVQFCGQACHAPMKPQFEAYLHSPHARVQCTECHIGRGAASVFRAKLNGLRQVYLTALDEFPRPIEGLGKIKISQSTCEQCHWPSEYVGNLDRTYNHYLDDGENTPYSVRLLLKVGGGDPTHGPVGGIHWHMNVTNKIEYIAYDTDKKIDDPTRQHIPWIRSTDATGKVTEYRTKAFNEDPSKFPIHVMDCMDCHSRPAHQFRPPTDAVDLAISLGKISTNLPAIKRAAVLALTGKYKTEEEALEKIAANLREKYPNHADVPKTIDAVQDIYRKNFFPEMKTDWRTRPNNIGHKTWPGCFRCHDNEHKAADGTLKISNTGCNSCHIIIAVAKGGEPTKFDLNGVKFEHPEEGWELMNCNSCHQYGKKFRAL